MVCCCVSFRRYIRGFEVGGIFIFRRYREVVVGRVVLVFRVRLFFFIMG